MTNEADRFPHGGDWAAYEENCGGEVLDFSANVSPLGLPDSVKDAVVSSLGYAHRYPDPECRKLRNAIADKYKLNSESVFCGNGAADIIYRLAYAARPRRALVFAPDFCEYESALTEVGCEVLRWRWMEEAAEKDRLTDFPASLPEDLDLIIFSNPNNPSGYMFKTEFLHDLLRQCGEKNILLVVDECFMDFTENGDEQSMLNLVSRYSGLCPDRTAERQEIGDMLAFVPKHPCLCVLRAFTKFYGMAGLRLGWCAASDKNLIDRMKKAGPPWSVSTPAQAAGVAALSDDGYARKLRRLITEEREWMLNELRKLGMRCVCGTANYILFYTEDLNLRQFLMDRGIAIRDCSNYAGLGPGWFRVAVRIREENEILIESLRKRKELN